MSIVERRKREKEALRARILSTAWQIVKEEGWQSLSIRKIADAIEYSVPVIYDYFESKDAILIEFGKQGFQLALEKMKAAKESSDDPEEQLKAIARAYWNFAFRHKEYYHLMWGMNIPGCELSKCLPETSVFRELVIEPMMAIRERSGKELPEVCLKYHTFWSILHGLVSIKMIAPPADTEQLDRMVMEDAVEGFIKNLKT